jgi:hypothetical protein
MLSSKTKSSRYIPRLYPTYLRSPWGTTEACSLLKRRSRDTSTGPVMVTTTAMRRADLNTAAQPSRLSIEMGKQFSAYQQNDSQRAARSLRLANKSKLVVFSPAPRCCRPNRSRDRQHERRCNTPSFASMRGHPTRPVWSRYGRHWAAPSRFATWLHAVIRLLLLPSILLACLQAVLQAQSPESCIWSAGNSGIYTPPLLPS